MEFNRNEEFEKFKLQEETKKMEENGKIRYEIPCSQQPTAKYELLTKESRLNKAMLSKTNSSSTVVLLDDGKDLARNVCFGYLLSHQPSVLLQSKNDTAVCVLSHAKARISEFMRYLNRALSDRIIGVSVKLIMTDTDSVAYQVRYTVQVRRNKTTGEFLFPSTQAERVFKTRMGSDKFVEDIELILSGTPEMRLIVDRAHYSKDKCYYDGSRKKKVGLYSGEVNIPNMTISFQACGPKNYQYV